MSTFLGLGAGGLGGGAFETGDLGTGGGQGDGGLGARTGYIPGGQGFSTFM